MTAPDIFALGGRQDDAELVALESELATALARFSKPGMPDDAIDALSRDCRALRRRINETIPRSSVGVAIKLRQVVRVLDSGIDPTDDDMDSLRQLLALAEAAP